MAFDITVKTCHCGNLFSPVRSDQKHCSSNCRKKKTRHTARAIKRANGDRYFYGIDGELGLDSEGREVYQLLGAGNDDYYDHIYRKEGLDWESIFEFLWQLYERDHGERTVYAGFFLRFDFSQWFKSWPENKARSLFTTSGKVRRMVGNGKFTRPVSIKGQHSTWYVNGIGERLIRIQKKGAKLNRYMAINDAGPFFQTSLLKAIDPHEWKDPICSAQEFAEISRGKEARGNVADSRTEIPYNRLENAVLCRMLDRYNKGLGNMGIHLGIHQWYGPGQAAQEWFKNIGLPTKEDFVKVLGPMWDICIESYYGGWFEVFMHGRISGIIYEYDINSAYPSIMRTLPCILHGTWRQGHGSPPNNPGTYVLVRAKVQGKDRYIGSMLHRVQQGYSISRPRNTSGVYWLHELQAAKRAGVCERWEVDEWFEYRPECNCPCPLESVAELYSERDRVGKATAEGKAYKLIYNSAYGKLAQSVGGSHFANPFYASLITAGCRVKILDAIATHPDGTAGVVMIATDAVFFKNPHPTLPISKELGEWGTETKEKMFIFKPGHYWDESVRQDIFAGKKPQYKARGVNSNDFAQEIVNAEMHFKKALMWIIARDILHRNDHVMPSGLWPKVCYTSSFSVVTIGQALAWNDWSRCGEISHDTKVGPIDSDPFRKRESEWAYFDRAVGAVRTDSYELAWNGKTFETESTPYDRRFGLEREQEWEADTLITPDGDMGTLILNAHGQGK